MAKNPDWFDKWSDTYGDAIMRAIKNPNTSKEQMDALCLRALLAVPEEILKTRKPRKPVNKNRRGIGSY